MCMDICLRCGDVINTDDDPECYVVDEVGCVCVHCRERLGMPNDD